MAVESAENIVNFLVNKSELNYNNIVNKKKFKPINLNINYHLLR